MNKSFKVFLTHLGLSTFVALIVVFLVFGVWYSAPLYSAVGVTHVFLILLAVDVCLGPLLTLVIYKPAKKTLIFDLTVIALLQLSALGYGLYAVAEGRPAWLVYSVDRFELIRVLDVEERNIEKAKNGYQAPSWFKPQWVAVTAPETQQEKNNILFEAIAGGSDVSAYPHLYQPLVEQKNRINKRMRSLTELSEYNPPEDVSHVLSRNPNASGWLPLQANNQDMVVLINIDNLEQPTIVDLRPWH